jgi:hypothetical protein
MGEFDVLAAPFFAASAVLLWSGWIKIRSPSAAVSALVAAGWDVSPWAVRTLGVVEILVGVAAIVAPVRPAAIAAAAMYALFALFLIRLLVRRVPAETCGCAGSQAVPPSWLHVAMNAAAVGVALSVAAIGVGFDEGLPGTLADHPAIGVVTALGAGLIAWLASLAVVYVPTLVRSYRPEEPAVAT